MKRYRARLREARNGQMTNSSPAPEPQIISAAQGTPVTAADTTVTVPDSSVTPYRLRGKGGTLTDWSPCLIAEGATVRPVYEISTGDVMTLGEKVWNPGAHTWEYPEEKLGFIRYLAA